MKKADLVALGKVVRSQGRDGRVKLKLNAKGPTGFGGATVYIRRPGGLEAFEVESLDLDRNSYFLKLKGVDTLAAADALAGTEILASGADFKRPGGGPVLRLRGHRLPGCRPGRGRDRRSRGPARSGGRTLLVVRRGAEDVYVPFSEPILVKVDIGAREIVIDPPDGLLELNEI